ncbi:hypothetical protein [Kitasatospora sp. NPDC057015]|uniref:hypothetical protein n=1 Tax=Kitasatospora sp. NPDC057015 TaxID=3346001 RepID=UPI00362C45A8
MIVMSGSSTFTDRPSAALAATADAFMRAGDRGREAAARFELGSHLFHLNRVDDAFEQLSRAAELFDQAGLAAPAAQALLGCGHAMTTAGRAGDGLVWFDRAISGFARAGDGAGELEASAAKLETLADLDRWSDTELSEKIIAATRHTADPRLLTFRLVVFRYRTQARLAAGDPVGSLEPARRAADVAGRLGDRGIEATFRLALAHNLRILRDFEAAAREYEQVVSLASDLPGAAGLEEQALIGLKVTLDG